MENLQALLKTLSYADLIEVSVIICLVITVCLAVILSSWYTCKNSVLESNRLDENRKHAACDSPECVRCQKYEVVCLQAREKLQRYGDITGFNGLNRIVSALKDDNLKPVKEQQPNVLYVPRLHASPWWTEEHFQDEITMLENNFKQVQEEFDVAYKSLKFDGSGWTTNRTETGCWNVFYFYNQGNKMDANCQICPQTTKILESLSSFIGDCLFANAGFSVLHPGTSIEEHYGPCNIRIRCHLGLKIPLGCALTVAQEERAWQTGKCVLFDDSFLHAVEFAPSETSGIRAVLLLDFWHPDLSAKERNALAHIF